MFLSAAAGVYISCCGGITMATLMICLRSASSSPSVSNRLRTKYASRTGNQSAAKKGDRHVLSIA